VQLKDARFAPRNDEHPDLHSQVRVSPMS